MNRLMSRMLILIAACVPLCAQWLDHPTPGVPRTADGKPNLSAPAPRTADGKPDLSGIWSMEHEPGKPTFFDTGKLVKGGLPFKPETAALMKVRSPQDSPLRAQEPLANCLPIGIIYRWHQQNVKVVQTPGLLLVLSEYMKSFRQIFLDGRTLEPDPNPEWDGYSVGRWDGDTLVVESNGFRDGIWIDIQGNPTTDAAKITERIRRVDFGHLLVEVTVDDPKAYTAPWTFTMPQVLQPDTELLPLICNENEKSLSHIKAGQGLTK